MGALFALIVLLAQDGSIFICVFIFNLFAHYFLIIYGVHYNNILSLINFFYDNTFF